MKSYMNLNAQCQIAHKPNSKQRGVVLFLALIALLVMSLAAVALVRSVDTNSVIAGNLAFKQAATASADAGVESAVAWLNANRTGGTLNSSVATIGYNANFSTLSVASPGGIEQYWDAYSNAGKCHLPMTGGVCSSSADTTDVAGNKVDFIIHRMCRSAGAVLTDNPECTGAGGSGGSIGNQDGTDDEFIGGGGVYYRVLVRVTGPRDTVSYVQAMVVL